MRFLTVALASVLTITAHSAQAGISQTRTIAPDKEFILGGDIRNSYTVEGQNRGDAAILLIARSDTGIRTLATIAPGEKFDVDLRPSEQFVAKAMNGQSKSRLYWHISGYSNLANPRSSPLAS